MTFAVLALPAILLLIVAALVAGGVFILCAFGFIAVLALALDCWELEIERDWADQPRWALEIPLLLAPILIVAATAVVLLRASGVWQVPGFASYDLLDTIVATLTLGVVYGTVAGVVGHEFIHRIDHLGWRSLGLLLQAFPLDTADAVEHVYGHHVAVATIDDPGTARRGEGFWRFLARSIPASFVNSWRLERAQLQQSGRSVWSARNCILQGLAIQFALFAACWLIGGGLGLLIVMLAGAMGRILVEVSKYTSHYGLLRVPGLPIEPRHSWNGAGAVVSEVMLNASCHSDHHVNPALAYWELSRQAGMPVQRLPAGVVFFVALVPPLYIRIMAPQLAAWDAYAASDAERALLASLAPACVTAKWRR